MKNRFTAFMILPFIGLLIMFIYYPFFKSLYNSFYSFSFSGREFVGIGNYIKIAEELHRETLFNTKTGNLSDHISILLNGKFYELSGGLEAKLKPGDTLRLMLAFSGG